MDVIISGLAWLPRSELTERQIRNLKSELTVHPRRTTDIETQDDPGPIFLFDDDRGKGLIGVPRGYYLKRKSEDYNEILSVSYGMPMRKLETIFNAVGPFEEQNTALDELQIALDGRKWGGVFLHAAPGTGKTEMGLEFARRLGRKTLILVHKNFLLKQWMERIYKLMPDARVGIIKQDQCEYDVIDATGKEPDFVIGINQSLAKDDGGTRYPQEMYNAFGTVISDECFIGNTLVKTIGGDKRIDEIWKGDVVLNAVGVGSVKGVFEKSVAVSDMRVVKMDSGWRYVCTAGHPWLTDDGWLPASEIGGRSILTNGDSIGIILRHGPQKNRDLSYLQDAQFSANGEKVLFSKMYGHGKKEGLSSVRILREAEGEAGSESFLFAELCREMDERESELVFREAFGGGESMAPQESSDSGRGIDEDDGGESYEAGVYEKKGLRKAEGDRAPTVSERWKRVRDDSAAGSVAGGFGGGMDARVHCSDESSEKQRRQSADPLQAGFGASKPDDSDRGGWENPFGTTGKTERREENRFSGRGRVESVEVPKPRDLERFGIRVVDGRVGVYNLRVSGHPSYILGDSSVVHNCHRVAAATWAGIIPRFNAAWTLGLSATPRRSDGAQDVFFYNISPITYSMRAKMMQPSLRKVFTRSKLKPIVRGKYRVAAENLNSAQVLNQLAGDTFRTRDIVDDVLEAVRSGRKILIISERLAHLKEMGEMFGKAIFDMDLSFVPTIDFYTGQWYTGEVWTETRKGKRGNILHRKGDPKMKSRTDAELKKAESANILLCTKQQVEEGLDIPSCDVLVMATPMSDIEQVVGRIQRWCIAETADCERLCPWRAGQCESKPQPIVVDIIDEEVPKLVRKFKRRMTFYKKLGALETREK